MCCANCARAPCLWPKPPASQQPLLWLSPPSTVPLLLTSAIQRENHHFLAFFLFKQRDTNKCRVATLINVATEFYQFFAPIDVLRRSTQFLYFSSDVCRAGETGRLCPGKGQEPPTGPRGEDFAFPGGAPAGEEPSRRGLAVVLVKEEQ